MLESPYDLGSGEAEELVANNVVLMLDMVQSLLAYLGVKQLITPMQ